MHMYTCIHVYLYTCMTTYSHVLIHMWHNSVLIHTWHDSACGYMWPYMYTCIHVYMYTGIHVWLHKWTCHIYIFIHIWPYMYICTYVACSFVWRDSYYVTWLLHIIWRHSFIRGMALYTVVCIHVWHLHMCGVPHLYVCRWYVACSHGRRIRTWHDSFVLWDKLHSYDVTWLVHTWYGLCVCTVVARVAPHGAFICAYICIHIYIYVYIYMYIHTHISHLIWYAQQ